MHLTSNANALETKQERKPKQVVKELQKNFSLLKLAAS